MNIRNLRKTFLLISLISLAACVPKQNKPLNMPLEAHKIIIAHRGASGYLPEHTLAAKAMAYAMHPDFIEQDLVLSKDDVPMVIHDIHLETVSDVALKFPERKRADGRYYVIDFTYDELVSLEISERFDPINGEAVYKERFPVDNSSFRLHSLQDEIELIQGLNKSTGYQIGIYPEIKEPAFHRQHDKDISKIVLKILDDYGYHLKSDPCILQCFDAVELKRIRKDLNSQLFLVQLLESKTTEAQLNEIATYADGIGPWYGQLAIENKTNEEGKNKQLVTQAHDLGLKVHAYTFRADDLGDFKSFDALLEYGFYKLDLDGIFTDFPDKAVAFLKN